MNIVTGIPGLPGVEPRPVVAELLGTLLLVFFGVGAAVLAGEYLGTLGIALAFGLVLLALICALGPVSGCQVNPAVTLAMLLAGRLAPRMALAYWLAQFVGAVLGAALLFLVAHQVPGLSTSGAFGTNGFADRSAVGISVGGALVIEVMMTFLLVFVVLSVIPAVTPRGPEAVPIGLVYAAVHFIGVPLTGTSVNPARSLGPALFAGGQGLSQVWLFLLAPLLGGALAVAARRLFHVPGPAAADAG